MSGSAGECQALRGNFLSNFCHFILLGIPMLKILFGSYPHLSIISLPLLVYHPTQILLGGFLVSGLRRWMEAAQRRYEFGMFHTFILVVSFETKCVDSQWVYRSTQRAESILILLATFKKS